VQRRANPPAVERDHGQQVEEVDQEAEKRERLQLLRVVRDPEQVQRERAGAASRNCAATCGRTCRRPEPRLRMRFAGFCDEELELDPHDMLTALHPEAAALFDRFIVFTPDPDTVEAWRPHTSKLWTERTGG
jgi:hypothetical protein